jgi:hypothetical protein
LLLVIRQKQPIESLFTPLLTSVSTLMCLKKIFNFYGESRCRSHINDIKRHSVCKLRGKPKPIFLSNQPAHLSKHRRAASRYMCNVRIIQPASRPVAPQSEPDGPQ